MNFGRFFLSCCVLLMVVATTACGTISDFQPNPFQDPTLTPDLPATIDAAVAQAMVPTFTPWPTSIPLAPSVSLPPSPTFTPRPTPATTPLSLAASVPPQPTFGPRPTLTPRSPLSNFPNGDWLERENPSAAESIKALPWVDDGIDQREEAAVEELIYLADDLKVFDVVIARHWVFDSLNQLELSAIEYIRYVAGHDINLGGQIADLQWLADGVEQPEPDVVNSLWNIVYRDAALAERIVGMPWVQDDVSGLESEVLENLFWIADADTGLEHQIVAMPWLQDGVTELESVSVENLALVANADAELARRIVGMAWLGGEVTELENAAVENLFWISDINVALGHRVVELAWLADDVTAAESSVIEELWYIAYEDAAAAARLVDMPFLRSLEPPDIVATESLANLAALDPQSFREVMSHPTVTNGITNEWAPIVATLYNVSQEAPALVDILLDPAQVTQEWRTAMLPHSGPVDLVVIRTGPGAPRSMDLLEHSVRSAEEFMGLPLPTNYVGLLFGNTVAGYSAGTNYSTHVTVLPEYDVDDGSENAEFAGHLIAHEVAHYYWASGKDWVDEGIADFMASIAERARTGRTLEATNDPCEYTDNIAELEQLAALGNDEVFDCNYSLGEGFFLDLYFALGDQAFREGLRRLYRMALVEDNADNYEGTELTVSHVKDAFQSDAAKAVVNRWYYGTAP